MTSSEIASALREADWDQFFIGDVPYADKSFRREQDARDYPVRLVYGLIGGFRLTKGLEPGHLLGMMLDRLTLPYSVVGTFDDLPIPYRAVATDLEKAERVVLKEGALPQAIRASMAIPGVFTPVIIDGNARRRRVARQCACRCGQEYGGGRGNRRRCGFKARDRTYIQSFAGMLDQSITVMMVSRTREILSQADIIISPELKSVKSTDWRKSDIIADLGAAADLVTSEIGPYPFKISRDRVAVEEAPVSFTDPASPLLLVPNRIGPADFDGWVQERGLYFAGTWDPRYATPLSMSDPGETPKAARCSSPGTARGPSSTPASPSSGSSPRASRGPTASSST